MDCTLRRLAGLSLALLSAAEAAAAAPRGLATWHPWQLDSVLVAWVLTQAGQPAPEFESVARGTPIAAEHAIDTPDSPYRRSAQRTAFDESVRLTGLQHACLPRLREAVRVVELAPWRKPEYPRVEAFEVRVLQSLPTRPMQGGLAAAFAEVDTYCRDGNWRPGG